MSIAAPLLAVLRRRVWPAMCIALLLVVFIPANAHAGSVRHGLSDTSSWVGSPIVLDLVFENVGDHSAPVIPSVDGLQITSTGAPNRMSSVQIINGHRTEQATLSYRYYIDATEAGTYELPAISLQADDKPYRTDPIALTFRSAADPSLLRVSVTGVPDEAWLGDSLRATLRIMIKPYADSRIQDGVLSASDMWRQVPTGCRWGVFLDSVTELQTSGRVPPISLASIPNASGTLERWYAYEIEADLQLLRAGPLDLGDILIRMHYPTALGRGRTSVFAPIGRLSITDSRPVTAAPAPSQTQVKQPPLEGRPPSWAGAVGQFRFDVTATPTEVSVGEPITLTMKVTDLGTGGGDLDLLQAPKLDQDQTITSEFKVPDDRPGGIVNGRTKTFTQSIRPTSTKATEIPPIAFPFFDPWTATYESSRSRPIKSDGTSARHVDASAIAGAPALPAQTDPVELAAVRGGLLANITDTDVLLARPEPPQTWWLLLVLLAPPCCFAGMASIRARATADRANPHRGRARRATRLLAARIEKAGDSAEAKAVALRNFVADRLGHPDGGMTSVEAVQAIRARGEEELATDLKTCLDALERSAYAGGGHVETDASHIEHLAKQLEGCLK